jgi:hypothetical protein
MHQEGPALDHRLTGRRNVNVDPAPTALVTQILPPRSSTNFWHRASPRA